MTAPISPADRAALLAAATSACDAAYAPYSGFRVGAALRFDDGTTITGSNVENASYGLSLCAETVAAAIASHAGRRSGLIAVAVAARQGDGEPIAVTPCGRCRQVLYELAALGGTDPVVITIGDSAELSLGALLPRAFGPANLAP